MSLNISIYTTFFITSLQIPSLLTIIIFKLPGEVRHELPHIVVEKAGLEKYSPAVFKVCP